MTQWMTSRELVARDDGTLFIITREGDGSYLLDEITERVTVGQYRRKWQAHRVANGADAAHLNRLDDEVPS